MGCSKILNSQFYDLSDLISSRKEYLTPTEVVNEETSIGFYPSSFNASELLNYDATDDICITAARNFVHQIENHYGLFCTLCVHYGEKGFIGWHTNANADFYNAICTFSSDGLSFFEYKNENQLVVRLQDPIGWSVKKSYWGAKVPIEHRAVSATCRITITFSSSSEDLVNFFIKSITGEKI
jgi:hypothetical protein